MKTKSFGLACSGLLLLAFILSQAFHPVAKAL